MYEIKWDYCINAMREEILPALGCTEPVAVALAAAKACSLIEGAKDIQSLQMFVSRNILKNAKSVGIPGTSFHGLEYAAALGAFGGNAAEGLEVFKDISPDAIEAAENFIKNTGVEVDLKDTPENLYVEAWVTTPEHKAKAIICGTYTHFVRLEKDGEVLYKEELPDRNTESLDDSLLKHVNFRDIFDFAACIPIESIAFIEDVINMNCAISKEGLNNAYGLQFGKRMKDKMERGLLGNDICNMAMMQCASAIDARMGGCNLTAMSNSGSGNQGITATIPVWSVASEIGASKEKLIRAVALSHIITIYIKKHLDRLSALCGATIAATGASCGITYLIGGGYDEIESAVKNMVGNLSGIICDGAKSGCSLKVSSTVQAAFYSAYLAMDGVCVRDIEGIVEQGIDCTIDNLGVLASKGMKETDSVILNILISK